MENTKVYHLRTIKFRGGWFSIPEGSQIISITKESTKHSDEIWIRVVFVIPDEAYQKLDQFTKDYYQIYYE